MNMEVELISVGQIVNTQGHKGEVKVLPLSDYPERFKPNSEFLAEKDNVQTKLTVLEVRPHKKCLAIRFKEIPDMDTAENYKGTVLKVDKSQLPELPEGTYYVFDIIGLNVMTEEGVSLGKVKDVVQTGANDVYVVTGQGKDYLIPGLKNVVRSIDQERKLMVIRPLDGLLDI